MKNEIPLTDSLAPPPSPPAQEEGPWYWVGLLERCPRSSLEIAGVHFPKRSGRAGADGTLGRRDVRGATVRIPRRTLETIAERLPLIVFRGPRVHRYPTVAEKEEIFVANNGRIPSSAIYSPEPNDIAAIDLVWLIPIASAAVILDARVTEPEPVRVTGIKVLP